MLRGPQNDSAGEADDYEVSKSPAPTTSTPPLLGATCGLGALMGSEGGISPQWGCQLLTWGGQNAPNDWNPGFVANCCAWCSPLLKSAVSA